MYKAQSLADQLFFFPLQELFSLDELRLPPIPTNYDDTADLSRVNYKKTFNTKPFKLPSVAPPPKNVPKTYTTRKGALLLYAENYFLPGSPKAKKRRRKLKQQQSALKLKTLTDLRDFILDYKRNGVSMCKPDSMQFAKCKFCHTVPFNPPTASGRSRVEVQRSVHPPGRSFLIMSFCHLYADIITMHSNTYRSMLTT